tara:strand:+ start:15682 stop:16842 length:1161 start_codon:yes stop_codon:yes gene_type:complete
MSSERYLFSSESVTEGHPDKMADRISDAILDAIMEKDKKCRVACETLVNTGMVVVAGEITTSAYVSIPDIVRRVVKDIGYTDPKMGFDYESCAVLTSIDPQCPDIAMGVDDDKGLHKEQGAGDQGLMFGYATSETDEFMPLPIMLAHKLCRRLDDLRKAGSTPYLRPDGKSEVVVEYNKDGVPMRVHTVVIAAQHKPVGERALKAIKEDIRESVINYVIPSNLIDDETVIHINATGKFVRGGPAADCGLTGRKIIVDTYGGMGRHGGGCFSGKDPSKVDRSASYMARYIAKSIVVGGLADRCEVQLAYVIGVANPVSVYVNTFGTGSIPDALLANGVRRIFPLTPRGIIEHLNLLRPIYEKTATYGHFGRSGFPWEKTDMVGKLRC